MEQTHTLIPIRPRHSYGFIVVFVVVLIGSAWYARDAYQVTFTNSEASSASQTSVNPDEWVSYVDAVASGMIQPAVPFLEVTLAYDSSTPNLFSVVGKRRVIGYDTTVALTEAPYYLAVLDRDQKVLSRTKFLTSDSSQIFSVMLPWDESATTLLIMTAKRKVVAEHSLARIDRVEREPDFYTLASGNIVSQRHVLFLGTDYRRAEGLAIMIAGREPFRSIGPRLQFHLGTKVENTPHDYVVDLSSSATDQDIIEQVSGAQTLR